MEADWEIEIGGGAPVIEALWPGFIDLHIHPELIIEIAEAAACAPLASLLLALNAPESPVWTSKCDLWEPEPGALASYIDLLPRAGLVFAEWQQAELFCREYVARLDRIVFPECRQETRCDRDPGAGGDRGAGYSIDLVIREAVAGEVGGFGITAYLGAKVSTLADASADRMPTAAALSVVMAGFADALPLPESPAPAESKLQ
jgi:hypothetical protein